MRELIAEQEVSEVPAHRISSKDTFYEQEAPDSMDIRPQKGLRVLHIYRTYFPETQGGVQEAIRQLCLATQAMGVKNTVFALARQPTPVYLDRTEGRLVRARSWLEIASCDFGGWAALSRCREAADESDIIQIHYPWPFADMLLPFIRRRKQPVVVTYHSDIVRQGLLDKLYAPLRRYLLKTASAIVTTSPAYARNSKTLQAYATKVRSIPLCLAAGTELDLGRVAHWEAQLGRRFFLFVGVLRYYKGLDFLIAAASQTKEMLVILGDGPNASCLKSWVGLTVKCMTSCWRRSRQGCHGRIRLTLAGQA
jgi:rhamnosyl/mannosyltransferase